MRNNKNNKREIRTLKHKKQKPDENNAIVTKADKGNSIVIVHQANYHDKAVEFINVNLLIVTIVDQTDHFRKK